MPALHGGNLLEGQVHVNTFALVIEETCIVENEAKDRDHDHQLKTLCSNAKKQWIRKEQVAYVTKRQCGQNADNANRWDSCDSLSHEDWGLVKDVWFGAQE